MTMPVSLRFGLRAVAVIGLLALVAMALIEARAWRREQYELKATLAATKSALDAADARERERAATLQTALTKIAAQKRAVSTPKQVLAELPHVLPLPKPITLEAAGRDVQQPSAQESQDTRPESPVTSHESPTRAVIPAEDLKPLYDFALDCKACQERLTAAHADLSDERTKISALTQQRDAALKVARGGGFWRRTGRALKWFALGAAAGAALAATR